MIILKWSRDTYLCRCFVGICYLAWFKIFFCDYTYVMIYHKIALTKICSQITIAWTSFFYHWAYILSHDSKKMYDIQDYAMYKTHAINYMNMNFFSRLQFTASQDIIHNQFIVHGISCYMPYVFVIGLRYMPYDQSFLLSIINDFYVLTPKTWMV